MADPEHHERRSYVGRRCLPVRLLRWGTWKDAKGAWEAAKGQTLPAGPHLQGIISFEVIDSYILSEGEHPKLLPILKSDASLLLQSALRLRAMTLGQGLSRWRRRGNLLATQ